jgi:hypothetical protein
MSVLLVWLVWIRSNAAKANRAPTAYLVILSEAKDLMALAGAVPVEMP